MEHVDSSSAARLPLEQRTELPIKEFDPATQIIVKGGDVFSIYTSPLIPEDALARTDDGSVVMGFTPAEVLGRFQQLSTQTSDEEKTRLMTAVAESAASATGTFIMMLPMNPGKGQQAEQQMMLVETLVSQAEIFVKPNVRTYVQSLRESLQRFREMPLRRQSV